MVTPIDIIHTNVLVDLLPGEVVHVGAVVAGPVRKLAPKYLWSNPTHKVLLQKIFLQILRVVFFFTKCAHKRYFLHMFVKIISQTDLWTELSVGIEPSSDNVPVYSCHLENQQMLSRKLIPQ